MRVKNVSAPAGTTTALTLMDPLRRASKREKDLADIARILEAFPHLEPLVPAGIRGRLL